MADDAKTLKLLIELGIIGKEDAIALNQLLGDSAKGTTKLGEAEKEAAGHADQLHLSHRGLHILFNEMGRETIPALGHAMAGALYGPIGWAIALGAAVNGLHEAFRQAEKSAQDFQKAMDDGIDVDGATKAIGDFQDATAKSAVAADDFARAMGAIADGQHSIKADADDAVASLHLEAKALDDIAKSKLAAAKADINADPNLNAEEKVRKLAALEDAAAAAKLHRDEEARAQEIAVRQKELDDSKAAAAVAAAAVPIARAASDNAGEQPERQKKLVESLTAQIKAAEERDKKIIEQIGPIGFADNSKTDFTSKLPGATSDEAGRYQVGKAQVESDAALIANFKAMLAKLDTPSEKTKVERDAATAAAALKTAEDNAKKMAEQVNALQREVDEKKKANFIETSAGAEVNRNEQHARDVDAAAKIEQDRRRQADEAERAAERATHLVGETGDHHDEAARLLTENSKKSLELAKVAAAAAKEHAASAGEIQKALEDIRKSNAALINSLRKGATG